MVPRHVLDLCTSSSTVVAALEKDPSQPPSRVFRRLFKSRYARTSKGLANAPQLEEADEIDIVAKCGSFPHRPSNLFLRVYGDVLRVLETRPIAGLVSPPLLGSSCVIPLTIVSVIPDIMRHYANLIARAEAEVLLATNYWERSQASAIISESLRELSKRVQARGGKKVVVKLMYDRGNVRQAVKSRIIVKPVYWTRIGLPAQDEIPSIALEVINYHRALLGTFHAKYLVVDRRVACLNSNNVQDRPNIEMMIQLEGPVVESFYDMALISWGNVMHPPLPLLRIRPAYLDVYSFKQDNEDLKYIDSEPMSRALRSHFQEWHDFKNARSMQCDTPSPPQRTCSTGSVIAISKQPEVRSSSPPADAGSYENSDIQFKGHKRYEVVEGQPVTSRRESVIPNINGHDSVSSDTGSHSLVASSRSSRGADDTLASSSGTRVSSAATEVDDFETTELQDEDAGELDSRSDSDFLGDFRPYILHEPHIPVPIAMVNRRPTGTPGHYSVCRYPQDVAWLSAMDNAQKSVFIQTPTFNASPIVSSALNACRRGVRVTLYLDLGFNDQGEMIPFQGGTNEEVVHDMYKRLNHEGNGDEKHLEVFWYTGKDQTRPLDAALRKRNCHVKFMAVDDQVAILGNGNQDTQSWFHSQEINVMIDSPELVGTWIGCIEANQNTRLYGRVSNSDGILRGENGETIQASGVESSNILGRLKGLGKVMSRVRGTGGF